MLKHVTNLIQFQQRAEKIPEPGLVLWAHLWSDSLVNPGFQPLRYNSWVKTDDISSQIRADIYTPTRHHT